MHRSNAENPRLQKLKAKITRKLTLVKKQKQKRNKYDVNPHRISLTLLTLKNNR